MHSIVLYVVYVAKRGAVKTVITFGTFDLLHIGHLNILERARALGDRLVVGVSTDELNIKKKGAGPVYREDDRCRLIASLRCVDEVFLEESLEKKREYVQHFQAAILVMGDDWGGKFDFVRDICEVVYLPRTPAISTTEIKLEVVKRALS